MTEAPDVYPDLPDDDRSDESADQGVESRLEDEVHTGDARVDEVLGSLAGLQERPLSEHARAFEQAHELLRAALEPDRQSA